MKRSLAVLLVLSLFLLSACFAPKAKPFADEYIETQSSDEYIEIQSAEDHSVLLTIHDKKSLTRTLEPLNNSEMWENNLVLQLPADAEPNFVYVYYKESTLLFGEDVNAERPYEKLMQYTTYSNYPYITMTIAPEVIKAFPLPQKLSTFTFKISQKNADFLNDLDQH